jgi:hypothetical protein
MIRRRGMAAMVLLLLVLHCSSENQALISAEVNEICHLNIFLFSLPNSTIRLN